MAKSNTGVCHGRTNTFTRYTMFTRVSFAKNIMGRLAGIVCYTKIGELFKRRKDYRKRKMETRIVKIEKGCFCIEYRKRGFSWYPWTTVNRTFKTKTKAEEYIIKHFGNGNQD